jgi:hypothetical protein
MPARSDRSPVSRLDPWRADRRPDAGAGADAVLALFLSRDGGGLGGVLAARAQAVLEGDLHPFMAHLQYFKDVLALPRPQASAVPQ